MSMPAGEISVKKLRDDIFQTSLSIFICFTSVASNLQGYVLSYLKQNFEIKVYRRKITLP
jgi:hypothetical protein